MATKTAKRTAGTATKPAAAEVKGDSEAATGESDGNAMLDPDGLIPDGRRVRLGVGVDEADAVLVDESDGIELEIAGELSWSDQRAEDRVKRTAKRGKHANTAQTER